MNARSACLVVLCAAAFSIAMTQENAAAPPKEKPAPALTVTGAALGTGVQERKLVGEGTQFALGEKVYLWLALSGGPADEIVVTWKQGDRSYETKLSVGGKTFHTWAYKTAAVAGPWEVSVADAAGNVLKKLEFTVGG
jgi:hypothetical protein